MIKRAIFNESYSTSAWTGNNQGVFHDKTISRMNKLIRQLSFKVVSTVSKFVFIRFSNNSFQSIAFLTSTPCLWHAFHMFSLELMIEVAKGWAIFYHSLSSLTGMSDRKHSIVAEADSSTLANVEVKTSPSIHSKLENRLTTLPYLFFILKGQKLYNFWIIRLISSLHVF